MTSSHLSIRPVLNLQARHPSKVFHVAADQRGPFGQGDGRDQQVAAADLPEVLMLPQSVEFGGGRDVNGKQRFDSCKCAKRTVEEELGSQQIGACGRLQKELKPSL